VIRWLTFQICAFKGHGETSESKNQGNFLELVKLLALYNVEVTKVVLECSKEFQIHFASISKRAIECFC
jgi:hypothetical protein